METPNRILLDEIRPGVWIARSYEDIPDDEFDAAKSAMEGDLESPAVTVEQAQGGTPMEALEKLLKL